jgi:hypothetical protein
MVKHASEDDDRRGEEAERRARMHDLERWAARHPDADPVHVLQVRLRDAPPGVHAFYLCRWSLLARLRRDAADSGDALTDLGLDTGGIARRLGLADIGPGDLIEIPPEERPS